MSSDLPISSDDAGNAVEELGRKVEVIDDTPSGMLLRLPEQQRPVLKAKSETNVLLYKHGLYELLNGGDSITVLRSSSDGGYVAIAATSEDDQFVLWVNDTTDPVVTHPSSSDDVLRGVLAALEDEDYAGLAHVYRSQRDKEVRRKAIRTFASVFPTVEQVEQGWKIDGMFLLTWEGEIYVAEDDRETMIRSGNGVTVTNEPMEAIGLSEFSGSAQPITIEIDGRAVEMREREISFLAKAYWLSNRREMFDDPVFWDRYAQRGN